MASPLAGFSRLLSHMKPEVRARVLRLNPDYHEGDRLRGHHPSPPKRYRWDMNGLSQGEFIRRHGRDAWRAIPNGLKYKDGRRRWIDRRAMQDNVHLVYQGKVKMDFIAWYPTKRYLNDPACIVQMIPYAEFEHRRSMQ